MRKFLPIVIPLEDHELLYSYVERLAKVNIYDNRAELIRTFAGPAYFHKDGFGYTQHLFNAAGFGEKMHKVYLDHTLYPVIAPFISKEKQDQLLSIQRIGPVAPLGKVSSFIGDVKVCPTCLKEAYIFHLNRDHQVLGVNICLKHSCNLLTVPRLEIKRSLNILRDFIEIEPNYNVLPSDRLSALFWRDFIAKAFDLELRDTRQMVLKRLKDLGLRSEDEVVNYFKEKGAFITHPQARTLFNPQTKIGVESFMQAVYTLFRDVQTFEDYLPEDNKKKNESDFTSLLTEKGYTLLSPYKKNLMLLRHEDCLSPFLITEHGFRSGLRCPFCKNMETPELFEIFFKSAAGNDYELLRPYKPNDRTIRLRHKPCGRDFDISTIDFLYRETQCYCGKRYTLDEAKAIVKEKNPEITLLTYEGATTKATFKHNRCQKSFEKDFTDFIKFPICSYCVNYQKGEEAFKRKVKDLVGDEYRLEGSFTRSVDPLVLKHKPCGKNQVYVRGGDFLQGQRCKHCNHPVNEKDFIRYVIEKSLGNYQVLRKTTPDNYQLQNTNTKMMLKPMKKLFILQELERLGPSPYLPFDKGSSQSSNKEDVKRFRKWKRMKRPLPSHQRVYEEIKKQYKVGERFRACDIKVKEYSKQRTESGLKILTNQGVLYKKDGVYTREE